MTATQTLTDSQRFHVQMRLSARHRTWCRNLPATDIDSDGHRLLDGVFIEYDMRSPVALIDYKSTPFPTRGDANLTAMCRLAQGNRLPAYVVHYDDPGDEQPWHFRVYAVTLAGAEHVAHAGLIAEMSEPEFVRFLHRVRGRRCCGAAS